MAKKTKKEKKTSEVSTSELTNTLIAEINSISQNTTGYDSAYILEQHESPADIIDWVSTGSDILDLAISNQPVGGYPVGRIVEIMGQEASGKSLLAAHALANTQKKGGLAVYIDTENAISRVFLEAIGVDLKKLMYVQMDNLEDIFATVQLIIEKIRTSSRDRLVTIVLDSVMGASVKVELEADFDQAGYATQKAIILSKALRKLTNLIGRERILFIATNQLRIKMGVTFGEKYTTSGGKALGFHSSVRLRTKALSKIKAKVNGADQVVGMKTRVVVQKNRIGPPHRTIDYEIYFDSGIDNYGGWLTEMKKYKLVKQGGAWYEYTHVDKSTGEVIGEHKFQSKEFLQLLEDNPGLKEAMWADICEKYIAIYRPGIDGGIDDVERETVDPFDEPNPDKKVKEPKKAKINVD